MAKAISFDEALKISEPFAIRMPNGEDIPGYFVDRKVICSTVPKEYKLYYLRLNDIGDEFGAIESDIMVVNFGGVFLTESRRDLDKKNGRKRYRELSESDPNIATYVFL